jgi:hypothetical protein
MNGLLDSQTSGTDWSKPSPEMLHQVFQNTARVPLPKTERPSVEQLGLRLQEQLEQQMAQFEAAHEAVVAELQRNYVFVNDQSVRSFFRTHRTAPQLLIEALEHLRQHFGNDTVFNLRAAVDEYGAETLYAVALWPGAVRDARRAIDQFDERWWIANSRQASGDVTFTYELV